MRIEGFLHVPQSLRHVEQDFVLRETHAKFCAAKFQFTMFQNASTNFGRALR